MDARHFDRLTRRFVLGGVAGVSLAPVARFVDATAKRKKNKRKRRKGKQGQQPESTCAEQCSAPCSSCIHRPVGPPLCSGGGQAYCSQPCLTDSDCIGTGSPYCYTGSTNRLTNEFHPIECVNGNTSICIDLSPCG
jgi:hypothetical protein